jgi:hypothetical protein
MMKHLREQVELKKPQGDGFVKQGTKKHGNYHSPPRPGDGSWLM